MILVVLTHVLNEFLPFSSAFNINWYAQLVSPSIFSAYQQANIDFPYSEPRWRTFWDFGDLRNMRWILNFHPRKWMPLAAYQHSKCWKSLPASHRKCMLHLWWSFYLLDDGSYSLWFQDSPGSPALKVLAHGDSTSKWTCTIHCNLPPLGCQVTTRMATHMLFGTSHIREVWQPIKGEYIPKLFHHVTKGSNYFSI